MLWLGLLFSTIGIAASDFFCINLSTIATILGMSESLAGVTFLAFGNGSPDVFSTFAAMSTDSSSLAIGELVGAAGFITAVVAGSMALVRPFKVARKSFVRDVGLFAVAAAFSMGFLSDGHLYLWECIGMVLYYVFYVIVVVVWHWWITRRAKRKALAATAHGHFTFPSNTEPELEEHDSYHSDEEAGSRPTHSRAVSSEDFRSLVGGIPRIEEPEDEDDDERRELLGEITTNMRLKRPGRSRRNTIHPVRPSLVGALEFQAVMKSMHKIRHVHPIPMHIRRYSDDPNLGQTQPGDEGGAAPRTSGELVSTGVDHHNLLVPSAGAISGGAKRTRAVSANDAAGLKLDLKMLHAHKSQMHATSPLGDIPEDSSGRLRVPSSGMLTPESASSRSTSGAQSPTSSVEEPREPTSTYLQLPHDGHIFADPRKRLISEEVSPDQSPKSRPTLPTLQIPTDAPPRSGGASPASPFPAYDDGAISPNTRLPHILLPPPASASVDSQVFVLDPEDEPVEAPPPTWWPTKILPAPAVIFSTLAPTLCQLKGKSWWEVMLSLVAAPSVFLLTITLPVVDADRDDDEESSLDDEAPIHRRSLSPQLQLSAPPEERVGLLSPAMPGLGTAEAAIKANRRSVSNGGAAGSSAGSHEDAPLVPAEESLAPKTWNRWLLIVQLYLAPVLIVLILYTQYLPVDDSLPLGRVLLRPLLISLLVSSLLLIPLLLTTTSTHRPQAYTPLLSLAGFVVSIAWISTVASQVVAVLKTFAIILNMSHAILGLTVFAVGNSLGDLVADITVARLGYPVMALSACFGGPMLNILLGIGLSGSYLLIRGADRRHHKHPDEKWKTRTYDIEVGGSLIVSGVVLLVTLVGLLIAVPLSGWFMTRKIAWALIALWCVGTLLNVVLEVTGVASDKGA